MSKRPNIYGQTFDQKQYEASKPLAINMLKPTRMSMYCFKCRKKVFLKGNYVKLKNGATAVLAVHSCNTKVYKIVGRFDYEV